MASECRIMDAPVSVKDLQWNTKDRSICIRERSVTLTTTQYQLLFPLRHGKPVTYYGLANLVYKCSIDDKVRMMIDKHFDRIRNKLRGTGIYVYSVFGYGYLLFPEVLSSARA